MEVIAEYTRGVQFKISAREHELVCDQPATNDGEDTGMSPPELLLASLASCAGFYAIQYLRTRQLPTEGVKIRVTAEKANQPARIGSFHIEVSMPEVEDRHREGVMRAVKQCLVHNTLLHPPTIGIELKPLDTLAPAG
jgi:uncharacterized OsmC-like protein